MTSILILGGGGMIGQKLAWSLAKTGWAGETPQVTLHDIALPDDGAPAAQQITGSIADAGVPAALVKSRPDIIFHLASIVSGEAEADFDKGWRVNMFPCWDLLEAIRAEHDASDGDYTPRLVFSSSIAAFGAPFDGPIQDTTLTAPLTSYGAQKVACELMVNDFSRKGFVDGVSIRLPTICVRPGKPNAAASGFFSGIIREPLSGQEAILPVSETVRHTHASPRSAVGFLRQAAGLETDALGGRRSLNMPGVSVTVEEQIDALRAYAGSDVAARIKRRPDETIMRIVAGWPQDIQADRARSLGFQAEDTFEAIIEVFVQDDLRPLPPNS